MIHASVLQQLLFVLSLCGEIKKTTSMLFEKKAPYPSIWRYVTNWEHYPFVHPGHLELHVGIDWLLFFVCRSNTTDEELGELAKTTNPDEINIDEDYSSDEDEEVEGKETGLYRLRHAKTCFRQMQAAKALFSLQICVIWPRGYKTFFMLNSAEHEIFSANKSQITKLQNLSC